MSAARAVATKNAKGEAAASRKQKNAQAVTEIIPGTQTGFSGEQVLVQRKGNACACGGGCPRCALQAKRAVSKQTELPVQRQVELEEEKDEEEPLQGKFESMQRQTPEEDEEEKVLQGKFSPGEAPAQIKGNPDQAENRTGMSGSLQAGLETLSGMDLSGVRVHRNSSKPAQVDAFAYTRGARHSRGSGAGEASPP